MSNNMFVIDVMSRIPVYEQVINQVEEKVLKKLLLPGAKMPSVRGPSMELAINPNTIQKAYTELERRGVIITVPGKGAFIAEDGVEKARVLATDKLSDFKETVAGLLLAGVSRKDLINIVNDCFKTDINNEKDEVGE